MMAKKRNVTLTGQQVQELFERERLKLDELRRRQQTLQNAHLEVLTTTKALESLKNTPEKEKIMVALGAGYFAEASLADNQKVKNMLAGRVMDSKSIKDALKELKERHEEFIRSLKDLNEEQARTNQKISELGNLIGTAQKALRDKAIEEQEKKKK